MVVGWALKVLSRSLISRPRDEMWLLTSYFLVGRPGGLMGNSTGGV